MHRPYSRQCRRTLETELGKYRFVGLAKVQCHDRERVAQPLFRLWVYVLVLTLVFILVLILIGFRLEIGSGFRFENLGFGQVQGDGVKHALFQV